MGTFGIVVSHLIFLGLQGLASGSTKQGHVVCVGAIGASQCVKHKANKVIRSVCGFLEEPRLCPGYSKLKALCGQSC